MSAAPGKHLPIRNIFAVSAGNALAFYDFLCFVYFASQIGRTFFPDPSSSVLAALATFAVGFITRPIGAIVIGRMADRAGRKPAMMLSFTLMGIAIVGVALTPGYAQIGWAAPVLVVLFRMLQGFALGGELGPTTAYLLEAAPAHRRGFFTSLQFFTQDSASFCASIMGFALASFLSDQALDAWGWRFAFLVGAAVVPVGLWVRSSLPETLHEPDTDDVPLPKGVTPMRVAVLAFVMLASGTMVGYVQTNLTTYASRDLHVATQIAFAAAAANTLANAIFDPIAGLLVDRFGRKPIMIFGNIALILATVPAFVAMVNYPNALVLIISSATLGALTGLATTPVVIGATEAVPRRIRAGTISIVYALAISMFGGLTPITVTWLTDATHNPLAPAFYMVVAGIGGLIAMLMMHETKPKLAK